VGEIRIIVIDKETKKRLAGLVAQLCRRFSEYKDLFEEPFMQGILAGMKLAYSLKWEEVCGQCDGCELPFAPPKGHKGRSNVV